MSIVTEKDVFILTSAINSFAFILFLILLKSLIYKQYTFHINDLSNKINGLSLRVNSGTPEWKADGADTWSPFISGFPSVLYTAAGHGYSTSYTLTKDYRLVLVFIEGIGSYGYGTACPGFTELSNIYSSWDGYGGCLTKASIFYKKDCKKGLVIYPGGSRSVSIFILGFE